MKKIRIGIIGCGDMTGAHQKGVAEIADIIEITATCDIDLERARKIADSVCVGI